jgi:pimeloyl-ACP methyl ester carboxylesterase
MGPSPRPVILLTVVALTACMPACRGYDPEPVDLSGSRAVSFDVDGDRVEGRLFGDLRADRHTVGVLLVHGLTVDQRAWFPFATELAAEGYVALTFDLRGYCPGGDGGCSEGERRVGSAWRDVQVAAAYLRDAGATDIVFAGSSMGGTAALVAAADEATGPVAGVIALSAPAAIEDLSVTPDHLRSLDAPTLFMAGDGDPGAPESAQEMYDLAREPKRVEILDADDHGAALLKGERADEARALMLAAIAGATGGGTSDSSPEGEGT